MKKKNKKVKKKIYNTTINIRTLSFLEKANQSKFAKLTLPVL